MQKTSRVPSYLKYMHVVIKYFWAGIASETAAETAKQFDKNYCRYPVAGIPTLTAARQDPCSYP